MGNIKLDIPDITVVVEKGNEYLSTVTPSEIYQILVNTGDNYNVVVDDAATITVNGSGSYLTVADYASTASYALVAQSLAAGGSIVYDTISASNAYFGNLIVSQSIRANLFTGSFSGDGSQLTGVGLSGGTNKYIPLWTGTSTLSSSLLFQTGSSMLLGSTTQHTPNAPDALGIYAGNTSSYNAVSVHGTTDNYFQINIKNFSEGPNASSDIVATTDSGTEEFGFINMGINGTGYAAGGDSIGGPDDAYLYMAGDGDLLIGNTSVDRRIILFSGAGSAISNARVFIDTQGFVGINTATPSSGAPEALAVQAIPESFNIINARASTNSYAQVNIKNDSNGVDASSDIVATADNGTEEANYINMGINSSQFTGLIGGPNDAYLYSTGSMLHIGNATPDNHIMFFVGGSDVDANNKLLLGADNLHQMTGSLSLSGSITTLVGVINDLTASFAMTASYVSGAASNWDTLSNKPDGLVSSSVQINTGSFSGSFTGTLIGTSSFATSASYAPTILPDGTVSSSLQINTGSFSGSFTGTLIGTSSQAITASYILPTGLPVGTISSSVQVSYPDLSNIPSGIVSSSTQASGWSVATASYVEYNNVVNKPTLVSSSTQINTGSFSGSLTGQLIGTSSWAISSSIATTSSYILPSGLPSGVVSSSTQINTGSFSGSFAGTLIGTSSWAISSSLATTSSYVEYTNVVNKPTLVSSSDQINTGSFSGSFTGEFIGTSSAAISASYAPTILPTGIVSSSTQIQLNQITGNIFSSSNFTFPQNLTVAGTLVAQEFVTEYVSSSVIYESGSTKFGDTLDDTHQFTGSVLISGSSVVLGAFTASAISAQFTGSLLGTASIATLASSVEYVNIFNKPTLVSSSTQINTGSFSGSFTGTLIGTSSNAISASYAPTILPDGTVSSSTQIDYTQIQNKPSVIATASYVEYSNIANKPIGLISSSTQVNYAELQNIPSGIISSSVQINTGSFSGSFTGVLIGTSSWANNAISASYINPLSLPLGTVSSSVQINTGSFSGSFTGTFIGTGSHTVSSSIAATASYVEYLNVVNKPTLISSSTQVNYTLIQNQPTTIPTASYVLNAVSSSFALTASYVSGAASDWDSIANKPSGLVSSSTQINTGSFSGSFTGVLIGTASWANNAISSSFATTASAATSITFTPPTASFATTASAATSITFTPVTSSYAFTASYIDGGLY